MTTPDPRRDRPTQALLVSAAVGPVLAVAGSLALWSSRAELPAQIAVHWGLDGTPDRYASFSETLTTAVLLTVLLPSAVAALGLAVHPSARGVLAGVVGGLATAIAGIAFGTALAQQGGATPGPFPVWSTLVTVVAAVAVGLALARWGRFRPTASGDRPPLPEDAVRLDVAPTTRVAWTGRSALATGPTLVMAAIVAVPLVWVALAGAAWVLLLALVVLVPLVVMGSARVTVDASGLRVSSLGLSWSRVPLDEVRAASTGTVSPLRDFGGWGWRIGTDGRRGYVTRAGEALVVQRVDEPDVVVTVDDADEAAAVLNTLAARGA